MRRWIVGLVSILGVVLLAAPQRRIDPPLWTFEVKEIVERDALSHTLRLIPSPPGVHFPRTCPEFVVHVTFERGVGVTRHHLPVFDEDGYRKAIRMLRDAQALDRLARLGSLDRGFGPIEGKPACEVASAGLGILLGDDGLPSVYSVY
jgi:hypothetical protein